MICGKDIAPKTNAGEAAGVKWKFVCGGAERDRTDDLLNAIEALSQLSYGPTLRWG